MNTADDDAECYACPVPLATVVQQVGAALDLTGADLRTRERALTALLDETRERIDEHVEFEPSFSRRLDPTDPEKTQQRPTS